ncbi:MAG: hypothetical protein ABEJ47_04905 [Halorhabdus sp.]
MKEEFWTVVCDRLPQMRFLLIVLIVLSLLSAFSVLYTAAGTASHIIAIVDFGLVVVLIVVTLFFQWRCAHNEQYRKEWQPEKRPGE